MGPRLKQRGPTPSLCQKIRPIENRPKNKLQSRRRQPSSPDASTHLLPLVSRIQHPLPHLRLPLLPTSRVRPPDHIPHVHRQKPVVRQHLSTPPHRQLFQVPHDPRGRSDAVQPLPRPRRRRKAPRLAGAADPRRQETGQALEGQLL